MNNMKTVKLNNGIEMPMLGFGTYQITPNTTLDNVAKALRLGYRMIDTAQYYGNEEGVGEAIRRAALIVKSFLLLLRSKQVVTKRLRKGWMILY